MKLTRPIRSWSKPKAPTESARIPALVTTPATAPTGTPTKWDRWFQRAAHASAPLALVLAFVGYWYTVRPVFQYQRLQEQAAKIEMDKAAAEEQVAKLRADQQRITADIQGLQANWEREKARNAQLASDATTARAREAEAQRRATEADLLARRELMKLAAVEATMQRESGKLDKARWELVILDLFMATLPGRWNRGYHSPYDDGDSPGAYLVKSEAAWPTPYETLASTTDRMEAKNKGADDEMPQRYYADLREFFRAREPALRCPKPDFAELRTQYLADLAGTAPEIEAYTTRRIEKIRADYAAKGEAVKITDEYRASIRRQEEYTKRMKVWDRHGEKIRALEKQCDDKMSAVIDELRKAKGAKR